MTDDPLPYPDFSAMVSEFLDSLHGSPRTSKTYTTGLGAFQLFLTDLSPAGQTPPAPPSLEALNADVLARFYRWLMEREYSRFTVRTYLAAATAFLSYLFSQDLLPAGFSIEKARERLRQVSRPVPYPIPRPDPELPRVIQYYDSLPLPEGDTRQGYLARLRLLRSRAIVHTLYASAGRIAEVAALDRKDVADGRRSEAVVTGKGDRQRFIFLTVEAQRAIAAYVGARQDEYQPLFISHGRDYGKRLSEVSIWTTVRQAARVLGLTVTPHDFRHFRACQMLEEGAPLEAIQDILGHADISTTRRVYAQYSKPAIREIFTRTTLAPDEALERWRTRRRREAEQAQSEEE
ncbi:MAG: tyrosine-type recombinase/integrase [Anaerolineae bacterium]|jgi:integrase|nr:tyrosine-type recombinase/integrase [Anaerolineae bacterium]